MTQIGPDTVYAVATGISHCRTFVRCPERETLDTPTIPTSQVPASFLLARQWAGLIGPVMLLLVNHKVGYHLHSFAGLSSVSHTFAVRFRC